MNTPLDKIVIIYCDFCEREANYSVQFGNTYHTCVDHQF